MVSTRTSSGSSVHFSRKSNRPSKEMAVTRRTNRIHWTVLCLVLPSSFLQTCSSFTPVLLLSKSKEATVHSRQSTALRSSVFLEAAQTYNALNEAYPLWTPMVTASVLGGVGDTIAQLRSSTSRGNEDEFDLGRTQRFMFKGFGGGLIWSGWFHLADEWTNFLMYSPSLFGGNSEGNFMTLFLLMGGGSGETDISTAVINRPDITVAPLDDLPSTSLSGVPASIQASVLIGKTAFSIALEQFIGAPLIYTFWDIPVPMLLNKDENKRDIPNQVQSTLPNLLIDNAKVWTFVSVV